MLLELHRPRPPLDAFVELITFYADYYPDHSRQKLLPEGVIEIIVDLTDTPKRLYDRDDPTRYESFRDVWVSGMRRDWIVIEAAQASSMAVIRFRPGGAYPFLGFPLTDIADVVTELRNVIGSRVGSLRDRILAARDRYERFAAIEGYLLELAADRLEANPAVDFMVGRLMEPGELKIAELVDDIGYSQKHVIALFKRWVGSTPKQFCRVRKFQSVIRRLEGASAARIDWADLAQGCGYYDQAHLINEFRHFSGLSPSAYLETFSEYLNYIPLDRQPG